MFIRWIGSLSRRLCESGATSTATTLILFGILSFAFTVVSGISNLLFRNFQLQPLHLLRGNLNLGRAHYYHDDGLLEVNLRSKHPIFELIARSQKLWDKKTRRASKTLDQAVDEYVRRYRRLPPLHFDVWFVLSYNPFVFPSWC